MLGAGVYQIPGILKAREQGIEVITCSYNADDPGMSIGDYAEIVDIVDKENLLRVARKYQADGIMTMCSDVGIPAVGYVNEKLQLTGISQETALLSSNKLPMKQAFIRHGVTTPRFARIESLSSAMEFFDESPGAVVLKTSDSSGSRGIVRANNRSEIGDAFTESFHYTKQKFIIIEDAIDGEEFGSQSLVIGGEVIYNFCHNDVVTSGDVTTPIGHSYPFQGGSHVEQMALDEIRKAVKALKISDAQLNCDFILSNNKVYVFEIGARMGGTSLPQLTENYAGLDWIQIGIDLSLGQLDPKVLPFSPSTGQATCSALICGQQSGTISELTIPDWLKNHSAVTYFVMEAKVGMQINKFRMGPDRLGEIVVVGNMLKDAEALLNRFLAEILIVVK